MKVAHFIFSYYVNLPTVNVELFLLLYLDFT